MKCFRVWMFGLALIAVTVVVVVGFVGSLPEVTQSTLSSVLHNNKVVFLYAVHDDCERCIQFYHTFLIVSQNFRNDRSVYFGTVSDQILIQAFDVTTFPGIVYYEFGNPVPKVYLGDLTSGALAKVVTDAIKSDFRKLDRHFSLSLTKDNYDTVMDTGKHFKLVMLHEAEDEDDIDLYEEIAETYENEPSIIIARINVDFEKKLKRKFQAVDYPSFYWFAKGTSNKKRYGGTLNVGQMITYVNKEAGLFRTKGGRLNPYAGLIEPLDQVFNNYGRALYEIRDFDKIRRDLSTASSRLPSDANKELVDFYFELLDEIEEDRTIEALDETRNRLYRRMSDVGPLEFDQLIRKRNIVQKMIDIIGYHLLQQLSEEEFPIPLEPIKKTFDTDVHGLEFHDEL